MKEKMKCWEKCKELLGFKLNYKINAMIPIPVYKQANTIQSTFVKSVMVLL